MTTSACPRLSSRRSAWLSIVGQRTLAQSDALVVASLLLCAAAARWPYLWDIPRFTDESNEALKALVVAHGRMLPLTNIDPYIGPLWNYLLAGVFLVTGPSLYTPRTVAAILGVLTVVPTYLLGRSVGGPAVGVLTAVFLGFSPAHIVVNSHIGWSNCITPLLTTLALWMTHRAVTADAPAGLAPAGVAWGLALQTHPVAFLFLPGVVVYVVWERPRWLKTVWPWVAAGLGCLACAPLVSANLRSGFGGIDAGLRVQEGYAAGETLGVVSYGRRISDMVSLLADSMSGTLGEFGALHGPFDAPFGLIFLALAALGLVTAWRHQERLPILMVVSYCVLLPVINARFGPVVPKARYVAPLLPLCYAAISLWIVRIDQDVARLKVAGSWLPGIPPVIARAGLVVGIVGLWVGPLLGLDAFYRQDVARGRTNADLYELIAAVNEARRPDDQILVDRALGQVYTPGGGRLYEHLQFAASVYGWNRVPITVPLSSGDTTVRRPALLILATQDLDLALSSFRLQETGPSLSERAVARVYRVLGPAAP